MMGSSNTNTSSTPSARKQQNRSLVTIWLLVLCLLPNFLFLSWWRTNNSATGTTQVQRQTQQLALPRQPLRGHHAPRPQTAMTYTNGLPDTFPRWGSPDGIPLAPVLDYIDALAHSDIWTGVPLFHHSRAFPETSYMIDREGIRGFRPAYRRTHDAARWDRWVKTHDLFRMAHHVLLHSPEAPSQWPMLHAVVTQGGGFPFLVWYGDNRRCSHNNWQRENDTAVSLPLFVYCAPLDCSYTIPMPQFNMVKYGKHSWLEWQESAANTTVQYPWHSKRNQVVWRGTLWSNLPNPDGVSGRDGTFQSIREQLLQHYTLHPNPHLDVKTIHVVDTSDYSTITSEQRNMTEIGGVTDAVDMADFQRYRAILDMDGNSWSSRFVTLLCYNSVILKVAPDFVDHFHFDVQPWVHYIPVAGDLSDLDAKAAYATDPANEDSILEMIANANAWCHERNVHTRVAEDMLDTWSFYVDRLYQHDAQWLDTWNQHKNVTSSYHTMGVAPVTEWAEVDEEVVGR